MATNVFISSDASFEQDTSAGVVLVDFWAEWCGPCQMMIPRLGELATKMGETAKIMKMNVDENPVTPQKFRIMSIPTMIVFKDGKAVEQLVGVKSVDDLSATLKKYL
ncbi:MAG: thioredoxin [Candidatus Gracilibacteria bacterium]|nr:thioredoxin [Candidatus Gracilibacteria bacterium]